MRILLVVHGFPPAATGGTEIYVEELARELARAGEDTVAVLAREADPARPDGVLRRLRRDDLELFLVNNLFRTPRSFADSYRGPALLPALLEAVDAFAPDVVHVHHLTGLATGLVAALAERRIPVLATLHDFWLLCHRGQLLDLSLERCAGPGPACSACLGSAAGVSPGALAVGRRLPGPVGTVLGRLARRRASSRRALEVARVRQRDMLALADDLELLLAPSQTLAARFVAAGFPPAKIVPTELGLDPSPFAGLERSVGDGRLRIGFVGSLMVSKAPHLVVEAFAGLPPGRASLDLVGPIVDYHGDSSYRRRLEPLLARPGVRWHGELDHAAIPAFLAGLDVVVVPSIWLENAPLVIREAFLAGLPVVAADLGGMAEAVRHGLDGLLFAPGEAADLGRCLRRLLDEPGLLERLASNLPPVRAIAEDAAWLSGCYAELVGKRGAAAAHRRLAAVVLNYRTADDVILAVRSLRSSRRRPDEIVVVDNGSGDGSAERLAALAGIELVVSPTNLGFSGGCNLGLRTALDHGAERLLLLNADAIVARDTIGRLERALERPGVGIAGPAILDRSQPTTIASVGMRFDASSGRMRHPEAGRRFSLEAPLATTAVDGVSGAAMLVRRELLEAVGLFDEGYFFSFEDLDLCLRAAAAGWRTVRVGNAVAYHAGSRSIGPNSRLRLYYAARNHLLLVRRVPRVAVTGALVRPLAVVALNLAHALVQESVPRPKALAAVVRGLADGLCGRDGPGPLLE